MTALTLVIGKDEIKLPPPGVGGVTTTSPDTAVTRWNETLKGVAETF